MRKKMGSGSSEITAGALGHWREGPGRVCENLMESGHILKIRRAWQGMTSLSGQYTIQHYSVSKSLPI